MTRAALLALALLAGCTAQPVRVTVGNQRGKAWPCYLAPAHVASAPVVTIGNTRCDVYRLRGGRDPLCLLVPRGQPLAHRVKLGPGDSGHPVTDKHGRVVGLYLGKRWEQVAGGEAP